MKIECIETGFSSNCYIVCINNGAYIIDPSCSVEVLERYLSEGLRVKGVLLTHGHIDHVYYLEEVLNKYKCKVYLSKYCLELLKDANKNCAIMFGIDKVFDIQEEMIKKVNDNDLIDGVIKVIYTPGHTMDSLCYLIEDKMFTGDTLFNMSVGRSDLYSGNYLKLVESIKKIYSLGNNFDIYPGHGEKSDLNNELYCNYYVKKMVK